MDDPRAIAPDYSADQRDELARIDYLLAELRSLRDRGLISEAAVATVAAEKGERQAEILRLGQASAAIQGARSLAAKGDPREALSWAEEARRLAPERVEGGTLSADLLARLGEYDR